MKRSRPATSSQEEDVVVVDDDPSSRPSLSPLAAVSETPSSFLLLQQTDLWLQHILLFLSIEELAHARQTNRFVRQMVHLQLNQIHSFHGSFLQKLLNKKDRLFGNGTNSTRRRRRTNRGDVAGRSSSSSSSSSSNGRSSSSDEDIDSSTSSMSITDQCIRSILIPHCCTSHLTYLDLSGLAYFTGLRPDGGSSSSSSIFVDIFQHTPNLRELNCSYCVRLEGRALVDAFETTFDDNGIQQQQQQQQQLVQLPKIEHLYLSGCPRIDSSSVYDIVMSNNARYIKTIHIDGCSQSIGLGCIVGILPSATAALQSLDISGLNNIRIPNLEILSSTNMPHRTNQLEVLCASSCKKVSFHHGRAIGFLSYIRADESRLLHENVNTLKYEVGRVLPEIADGFSNLKVLRMNNLPVRQSSAGTLGYLALSSCQLEEVELSGCEKLDDIDVQVLTMSCCTTLKKLNVRCSKLTDRAIVALGTMCRELVDLDISACFNVTHEGVLSVANGCPKLKILRLSHLNKVSNDSLTAIGTNLRQLLVLDVRGCTGLSRCDVLPPTLIEIDIRDTSICHIPAVSTLAIKNRRRLVPIPSSHHTTNSNTCYCSASLHSQRWKSDHGLEPSPMWSCRQCNILESRNRAVCGVCIVWCHKNYDVFLSSLSRFYCDCAFGFGTCGCKALQGTEALDTTNTSSSSNDFVRGEGCDDVLETGQSP